MDILLREKRLNFFLNVTPRKDIFFGNKGVFWISKIYDNDFYSRNDDENDIKIGIDHFKYGGSIENAEKITKENTLYNLNSNYNASLLDNVKFIHGIAEFNITD